MGNQSKLGRINASVRLRGIGGTAAWLLQVLWRKVRYFRRLRHYVRRGGYAKKQVDDGGFDERFGVDTGGFVKLADLGIGTKNWVYGEDYQPIPADFFRDAVGRLPIKHEDFIFIDIGSGKGRPLLLASDFPFKKIIGVEFSPELNQVAQENIRNYQSESQRCKGLESVCMDATAYPLPAEPTVFYMFHPFGEEVMSKMLNRIGESLERRPRQIFLLYIYPAVHQLMDKAPFLKLVDSGESYRIYTNA